VVTGGLGCLVVAMLVGAALGAYHAGVEWKWWEGPRDCSGELGALTTGGSLLDAIATTSVVRCDQAAWRLLGLSLAGYNVLISLALSAVAAWGLATRRVAR
jgi:disulfide bond formation protein DsbB